MAYHRLKGRGKRDEETFGNLNEGVEKGENMVQLEESQNREGAD